MNDKAEMTEALAGYYQAFSTLDVQRMLSFFHEPTLLVAFGRVAAMPTHVELSVALASAADGLRSRGYARSELINLQLKQLDATTGLANGVAVRYKSDGKELERVGVTYLLHKASAGWKIVVLVAHDTDAS